MDSIRIHPAQPTIHDSVSVLCFVTYPNLGFRSWDSLSRTDSAFTGQLKYCGGLSQVLGSLSDTFVLGKLSEGNYAFYFWPGFNDSCNVPQDTSGNSLPYPYVKDTLHFTVSNTDGLGEYGNEQAEVSIYPNPTTGTLKGVFNRPLERATGHITSIQGKMIVQDIIIERGTLTVDVSALASGIYFLVVQDDSHQWVRKFVKD